MPEADLPVENNIPRIGVVVCGCGGQISRSLDVDELSRQAAMMSGVCFVAHEAYPCSAGGKERLLAAIQEHNLERILIAGCAPRLVEKLFQRAVEPLGMDPAYVSVVNIRELAAAAAERDIAAAQAMAVSTIGMGVARLSVTRPAPPHFGKVTRAAVVIGATISGLTVAHSIAERGIPVTLVDSGSDIRGTSFEMDDNMRRTAETRREAVLNHPNVRVMLNTRLTAVNGHPGEYVVWLQQGGQTSSLTVGAIVVANLARPKDLGNLQWFDRSRVKTQQEFSEELARVTREGLPLGLDEVVFFLCAEESQLEHCSRVCCNAGIRQALQVKQLNPHANVTVLFRDLYLGGVGGSGEADLIKARQAGITFFRYRKESPPVIGDRSVDVQDLLTGVPVQIPYERVVLSMPMVPVENTETLSALLDLPKDEYGFLAEPRVRLRPGRYADPGIYVLGSSQLPADTAEALFQAYLTAARAMRFLSQERIRVEAPVAEIDAGLCTGCGNCPQVCPVDAIHLERRDGVLSLSEVDGIRCIGCGNCVVVCPVKAITLPGWDNVEIPVQISAALDAERFAPDAPRVLMLACEWSAYGAAEAAGHRRLAPPPNCRILRMNCSARFDPYHILWAFLNGADGVLLGACAPGECHYGMGNLYAKERVEALRKELAQHGVDPRRLRLEYFSVNDGQRMVEVLEDFNQELVRDTVDRGRMPAGRRIPVVER